MQRRPMAERPWWKTQAEQLGFVFHTMHGQPYWDETACWQFGLREVEERIEAPAAELHAMCLALVERAVGDERLLRRLAIPERFFDLIRRSWQAQEPALYGRFDLAYDGRGPAKLLEYNADTPTSLYETAFFQWLWLEEAIQAGQVPPNADQFNRVQECLIEGLAGLGVPPGWPMHFAAAAGSAEDRGTVRYLEDCALQAGLAPRYLDIEQIGVDTQGQFTGLEGEAITHLFKLYPWEWLLREDYASHLDGCDTRFTEPPWKAILSNKGILPLLWEMFEGHPNLLPAYFEDEAPGPGLLESRHVRKPLLSREGANVAIVERDRESEVAEGPYGEEGHVLQLYAALPEVEGNHMVVGAWIVNGEACGMGLREDRSRITRDLSRFLPHIILD